MSPKICRTRSPVFSSWNRRRHDASFADRRHAGGIRIGISLSVGVVPELADPLADRGDDVPGFPSGECCLGYAAPGASENPAGECGDRDGQLAVAAAVRRFRSGAGGVFHGDHADGDGGGGDRRHAGRAG
ncbi:hypothetical protein SDC9_152887 [bioreactor metagenome]|uniref:Uncharacterized protein n=1 Tax=bioreactor metagenome TaxID=1076179 RepID=A0A645EW33_9ZZZZ